MYLGELCLADGFNESYDESVPRIIGDNLRELRQRLSLNQERLAELLGHSRGKNSTISKWENDPDWLPSRRTIQRLCEILKCEPWELFRDAVTPYDRMRVRPLEGIPRPAARTISSADVERFQGGKDFERRVGMPDRRMAAND